MSRPTTAPMTTPAAVSHGPMVVVIASSSKHTALGIHRRSSRSSAAGLEADRDGSPSSHLPAANEAGKHAGPRGHNDQGDRDPREVLGREPPDHQQAEVDLDDVPAPGDEQEAQR